MANVEKVFVKPPVLITGAGSGIGKAMAQTFSAAGHLVVLAGRDLVKLKAVAQELKSESLCLELDLNCNKSLKEFSDAVNTHPLLQKGLGTIIHNAGVYQEQDVLSGCDQGEEAIWQETMQVNFLSVALLTQKLLPWLLQLNTLRSIMVISSGLADKPSARAPAYCASKAALNAWVKSMALALAPYQVRVNAISPGIVNTPIHKFFHEKNLTQKQQIEGAMAALHPLKKMGEPLDVAKLALFIASPDAGWMTGSIVNLDGGLGLI